MVRPNNHVIKLKAFFLAKKLYHWDPRKILFTNLVTAMPDKQRLICEIVTDQCISLSCNWESSKSFLPSSSSLLLHLWVGLMHYLLPSTALCLILVNRGTSEREPCLRLVLLHPHRLRGLDLGASIKLHNSLSNVAPIWLLSVENI